MISVERKNLPENKSRPLSIEEITQRRELIKSRTEESISQLNNDDSLNNVFNQRRRKISIR